MARPSQPWTLYHGLGGSAILSCTRAATDEDDGVEFDDLEVEYCPIASCPTSARPGTFDKVEEMIRRKERGEALFHPSDAREDDRTAFRPFQEGGGTVHRIAELHEKPGGGIDEVKERPPIDQGWRHTKPPGVSRRHDLKWWRTRKTKPRDGTGVPFFGRWLAPDPEQHHRAQKRMEEQKQAHTEYRRLRRRKTKIRHPVFWPDMLLG